MLLYGVVKKITKPTQSNNLQAGLPGMVSRHYIKQEFVNNKLRVCKKLCIVDCVYCGLARHGSQTCDAEEVKQLLSLASRGASSAAGSAVPRV